MSTIHGDNGRRQYVNDQEENWAKSYVDRAIMKITSTVNTLADGIKSSLDALTGRVDGHIGDKNNPHSVTKTQMGLSNVDNIQQATKTEFNAHTANKNNPHAVTKAQVGLSSVPNLDTTSAVNNQHTHSNKSVLDGTQQSFTTTLKTAYDNVVTWINTNGSNLLAHLTNTSNPHSVTKSQVGLGNVENTADMDKPLSTSAKKYVDDSVADAGGGDMLRNVYDPQRIGKDIFKELDNVNPIGSIRTYGYELKDDNMMLCDGSLIYKSEHPELYAKIGGNYGSRTSGKTWTLQQTSEQISIMRSVCWSPELGMFAAVGGDYPNFYGAFYTSTDGTSWTLQQFNAESSDMSSVCWSPELGIFVAAGTDRLNSRYLFYTSENGITWTLRDIGSSNSSMSSVCWSPELNMFIAVGMVGGSCGTFYTSSDGITWTLRHSNLVYSPISSVCWSPELGMFAAVGGDSNASGTFYTSSDGITWTLRQTNSPYSFMRSVCWSPELGMFAAVGASSYGIFYTSTNGVKWTLRHSISPSSSIDSVCWSPELGMFVAVGRIVGSALGRFYTSSDGITWTLRQTNTVCSSMYSVCWSPELGMFAAAGEDEYHRAMFYTSDIDLFALPDYNNTMPYTYIRAK